MLSCQKKQINKGQDYPICISLLLINSNEVEFKQKKIKNETANRFSVGVVFWFF